MDGTMNTVYLSLGTNTGNREDNLKTALKAISLLPGTKITKESSVYETEPWGYEDQPMFLNMCAEIETGLSPHALLGACLGIEAAMGRTRLFKNAPRTIDIDILLYNDIKTDTEELTIPHPRMYEREFVMKPLEDLGYN
ncbi:MAG: 2-amino-4-hydroxy-6-hydroxymethyldihydropteridine diphosphokinase [Oscillospiraceae bacterium]|nr:2-amino-4-hydroxy-6-hydroxymethyldihydropteridine diphosphokinase [Oscillospiraceae bacterium]